MLIKFLGLTQTRHGSFGRGETLDLDPEEAKDLARLSTVELVDEAGETGDESDPAVEFVKETTDLDPEEVLDGIDIKLTQAGHLTSATKKAILAKLEEM